MAAWMTLDDVNSEDAGLHVLGYPPRAVPRRKAKNAKAPGGETIWIYDGEWGYEDMILPVTFYMREDADVEAALAFLQPGSRKIVFGDQPDWQLVGRVDDQIELEKLLRERQNRRFKVNFTCRPFRTLAAPGEDVVLTEDGSILHPGTYRALPQITVEGEGEGVITTHLTEDFVITGMEAGKPLVIDSAAMIVTDAAGIENKSHLCSGDYPVLLPGGNDIRISGGITRLTIRPNLAWMGR